MILITGAAGLLGRELIRRCSAEGLPFRATDCAALPPELEACEFERGELRDAGLAGRACRGVSAILHTAAVQHHSRPPKWGREAFFRQNVAMTRTLVDGAIAAGVRRIVMVSSDMVYGMPPGRPLRESDEPRPIGPYGRSKLGSEAVCLEARARGLAATILRPRLIVGPYRLGILQRLFDRIRAGKSIPMLGDGRNRYQMVAVADVAAACLAAVERGRDGLFNLGSSDPPPVRELLSDLARRAGSRSKMRSLPAGPANLALWTLHGLRIAPLVPEQFRIASVDYVLDTSAARRELGWTPRYGDADMLWEAYRSYAGALPASA